MSLCLTLEKIANIGSMNLKEMKVVILGVGKMGTNLSRVLYNKVRELTLIDINPAKIAKVEKELLKRGGNHTKLRTFINHYENKRFKSAFSNSHISICTTTNLRRIIRTEDIPKNTIIIDDSRPEAISRDAGEGRIVLEGGLMKILDSHIDYNFGFGFDNNVFGCLAETYALALNGMKTLKATLGDIESSNYERMKTFCLTHDIGPGDLKTLDNNIPENKIEQIMKNKSLIFGKMF